MTDVDTDVTIGAGDLADQNSPALLHLLEMFRDARHFRILWIEGTDITLAASLSHGRRQILCDESFCAFANHYQDLVERTAGKGGYLPALGECMVEFSTRFSGQSLTPSPSPMG